MRVWLNDRILNEAEARISPFDRGFIFGDGVYEGIRFFNRVGVGMDLHVQRLHRSLEAVGIRGFDAESLHDICAALLEDAGLDDAMVYAQVTRGVQMPRYHQPTDDLRPTVFAYADAAPSLAELGPPVMRTCRTCEDLRWKRCEIKCTSLLANVLALMDARGEGFDEPILHRDGFVGEGAMTNVFAVIDGTLVSPPLDDVPPILHGVTRAQVFDVAPDIIGSIECRRISIEDLRGADEVMITSSRRMLDAVVKVDDATIGDGAPGPIATALLANLKSALAESCGVVLHSC